MAIKARTRAKPAVRQRVGRDARIESRQFIRMRLKKII
jgi:hypothetical protein